MTLDDLYALYRYTYDSNGIAAARSLIHWNGLSLLARAVAEFAESEAQDGKPIRSVAEFRLALTHGAGALVPLGWART